MGTRLTSLGVVALLPFALSAAQAQPCFQPDEYDSQPQVQYDCPVWGITWSVDSWTFADLGGGQVSVTAKSAPFPALTGTLNCADSTFFVSTFLSGLCLESYTLSGKFRSETHWTGTFSAWYGGYCEKCAAQDYPVEGSLGPLSVPLAATAQLALRAEPNPVRDGTHVTLSLARSGNVLVEVLDVSGRRVGLLHDGELSSGSHRFWWGRGSVSGHHAAAGVYLVRARADQVQRVTRIVAID
jgi:hypothetical protein